MNNIDALNHYKKYSKIIPADEMEKTIELFKNASEEQLFNLENVEFIDIKKLNEYMKPRIFMSIDFTCLNRYFIGFLKILTALFITMLSIFITPFFLFAYIALFIWTIIDVHNSEKIARRINYKKLCEALTK